jgi:hypothetical protein
MTSWHWEDVDSVRFMRMLRRMFKIMSSCFSFATINTSPRLFPEVFDQVELRRLQRPSENSCFLDRKPLLEEL